MKGLSVALFAVALLSTGAAPVLAAEEGKPAIQPAVASAPDYTDYQAILNLIVLDGGPSTHQPVYAKNTRFGTRVGTARTKPSALEGNRIYFQFLRQDTDVIEAITRTRKAMELSVTNSSLPGLSPEERLAYWLNLHNITIIEQLAQRFPVTKIKRILYGRGKTPGILDEPLLTIGGETLSLHTIQEKVIAEWDDPLVIYGFFLGVIGSPDIRTEPYRAETVWQQLSSNAKRFVNSIRGTRVFGSKLNVSVHYKLAERYFGGDDAALKAHILEHMNANKTRTRMERTSKVDMRITNWRIANLGTGPNISSPFDKSNAQSRLLTLALFDNAAVLNNDARFTALPAGAQNFVRAYREVVKKRLRRDGTVDIEEIDAGTAVEDTEEEEPEGERE